MKKICNIITTIAALGLFVISFVLQCQKKDDGSYMNCHNANISVAVVSCVIIALSILLFILKNKTSKKITYVITAAASILCAIIPGTLIHLCMMPEMTCRAQFRPTVIVFSIVIFLSSIAGLLFDKE
jgi:uncharacterized integral membrane protein